MEDEGGPGRGGGQRGQGAWMQSHLQMERAERLGKLTINSVESRSYTIEAGVNPSRDSIWKKLKPRDKNKKG